jgi:hypothetical protein
MGAQLIVLDLPIRMTQLSCQLLPGMCRENNGEKVSSPAADHFRLPLVTSQH